MLHANFMTTCFIKPDLLLIKVVHRGTKDFGPFLFASLDLDWMTFIYKFDLYPLEIYQMCRNELPTSRLSKVIELQTYIHTPPKLYTMPLHLWSENAIGMFASSTFENHVHFCFILHSCIIVSMVGWT